MRVHVKHTPNTEHPFILNLDREFNPLTADALKTFYPLDFTSFGFHGGEPHIKIKSPPPGVPIDKVLITTRVNNPTDLLVLILATDALRNMGVDNIYLFLPYVPGGRQDRVCANGEPFTLKVIANLLNMQDYRKVIIFSPHSEVTPALLNKVEILHKCERFVLDIVNQSKSNVVNIVSPDAGATKRTYRIAEFVQGNQPHKEIRVVQCSKKRDVRNGTLTNFSVHEDDLGGHPTLLVDDVVSMGGTFLGLAKELRKKNCGPLGIYVAHADCQEGLNVLERNFDHVFTTNSKGDFQGSGKVKIIPLKFDP